MYYCFHKPFLTGQFNMRILKALVGGIVAFFGIIFGGLLDNVTSAFRDPQAEPARVMATAAATTQSVGSPEAPTAVSGVPEVDPVVVATSTTIASDPTTLRSQPTVEVKFERPFVPNEVPAPRPRRRPGATMSGFMDMAREVSTARR